MLSHTLTTILGLQASPLEIASRRLKSSSRARQRRVDPIDDSDSNRQLSTADENSPSSSSPLTLRPGFPTAVPTILEEEDEDSQADYTRRKRRMQQQIRKSSSLREEMPMNGNDTSEESSF